MKYEIIRDLQMAFQLQLLNEELLFEHVFQRYVQLGSHASELKQDLGVLNKADRIIDIDIEPPATKRSKKKKAHSHESEERYNFSVEQSITSLFSSKDNFNSTTGYVLWSTTPFFIRWLLYNESALPLRSGGCVTILNDPNRSSTVISPLIPDSNSEKRTRILELGTGISGVLPIVLGNHVDSYICTDQKGILKKLKCNLTNNILQLNRRKCVSKSLEIDQAGENSDELVVNLEVMLLDWEDFHLESHSILAETLSCGGCIYVIAMDVIYNEFLIEPFLKTLKTVMDYFQDKNFEIHALIGIHLRSQEVLTEFLQKSIVQYIMPVHHISDASLEITRFNLYYI